MRVQIATLGWGLILDKHGNGRQGVTVKLQNLDATDATVYSAASGGTTLTTTGDLTTGAKGSLPGYMEVETYLLTIDGVTYQVEAVSGRTAGAATPLDDSVTLGKLNAAVKPSPSGSAAAGDLAVRKLGTGASDAAAGNDSRLSDQRTPTDGSVTAAKVNGSLKPSGSAATTDESLRRLGTGSTHAAAGDDARFPTPGQKNALAGTSGTPGTGNEYLTKADAAVEKVANKDVAGGYAGLGSRLVVINTRKAIDPRNSQFGAIGEGNPADAAADTAGIQAALMASFNNSGRKVVPGDGVYYYNGKLGSIPGTGAGIALPLSLEGEGFGHTIFRRTTAAGFLDILGNLGSTTAVVGSIQPGDSQITLGSGQVAAKGIAAGSKILVASSKLLYSATDSLTCYGERLKVKSVSGDVITVDGYIEEQYLSGDSPTVAKITDSNGIYVGGITFEGTTGTGSGATGGGVVVQYCQNVDIDIEVITLDNPGLVLADCASGSARVTARDLTDDVANSRFGYGRIDQGTTRDIDGAVWMAGGRHAYTTGGNSHGFPRHCSIIVRGRACTQAVADTHEGGRHITFPLIEVHNTYSIAAKMRAPDWSIGKLVGARVGGELLYIAPSATGGSVDSVRGRQVGMGTSQPGPAASTPGVRVEGDNCAFGRLDIDGTGAQGVLVVAAGARFEGNGRVANPGQVDATLKRCFATGASGSDGSAPFSGASDMMITGRVKLENADYGIHEHAAGAVAEANVIGRSVTNLTNRAGIQLLRRMDEAGQGTVVLPRFGADVNGGTTPLAQQAMGVRWMPARDFSLVSIGWIVDAVGGAGDSCEVALLDAAQNVLLVSPPTTGKLNTAGQQKIALTGGPYAAKAGTVYYLVLDVTAFTAGLKLGWRQGGSAAGAMNPFGTAGGTAEAVKQNTVTSVSGTGWNGSASPNMGGASGAPMLLPLES